MTDTEATGVAPRRWPRWKGALLFVSLALNLVVFGLFAAVGWRHGWQPPAAVAQQVTVMSFARTLPAERKQEIWEAVKEERRAMRPHWRELRAARSDARAALIADPFDAVRYRAAHDHLLDEEIKVRKAAHSLLENIATRLTPEERRAFAEWQEKGERHWRRHRHRDRRDGHSHHDDELTRKGMSTDTPSPSVPSK